MFCSKWVLVHCAQPWQLAPGCFWPIRVLFPGGVHRKAIVRLRAWSIRNTWPRHQIRNSNSFYLFSVPCHRPHSRTFANRKKLKPRGDLYSLHRVLAGKCTRATVWLFADCIWLAKIGQDVLWLIECDERFTFVMKKLQLGLCNLDRWNNWGDGFKDSEVKKKNDSHVEIFSNY